MKLISPSFEEGAKIPKKYTCDGENISPPLEVVDIHKQCKSLALIVDDPDTQSGDFVHWVMWNINSSNVQLDEGIIPEGSVEGMSDAGTLGYTGPCPPSGVHHYRFTVFALDNQILVDPGAIKEDLEAAMRGHIVDRATLIGVYSRNSTNAE